MRSNAVGRGRCARGLKKEGQARRCNCLLKIITAVFAVGFVVSIFFTISAFATANLFKIQNAELSELSTTTEGAIISFDESNIVSDVTFHKLNDSAKYTITLKNTDNKNRIIESVTDDSENPYISYEYEQHQGEQIDAGANFVFTVTAKYTTATSDISQRAQVDNVKFLIHFTGIEEAIPININPKTSDNLLFSVSLLIVSAVGLMIIGVTFIKKHKKANKFIAAGIIAVAAIAATTTVKAATIEINSFTFSNNFSLKDKLIVTYEDGAGNSHGMIVDFNESVTIGDQEKDGYIFAGWEDETGTSIDLTQPITDDITIKPVFTKNNYSVIFDKNQGDGSMANLPMFYDEPKQLTKNAFTRTGYAFTGWNTNAGGDGISYADEQEVSNLTKENGGSVTLYAQWSPIHYTISFNGNGATDGTMNSISAEYDKEIQLPASSFARAGYAQNGWKNGTVSIVDQATVRNLADSEGATVTLDAVWTANTNTRYTVIHKKMHINGEGYFEADRDNLTGTTGTEVTPDRKEYTGFTTPSAQTKKILGDNSTEFIYEYVRNKYHFEVTDRTYITNDSDADGDYYYESTVTITAEERPGYEFEWSDGNKSYTRTITIGTEAISLTPNYTEVQEANYTITHEKQKLDGSFELAETETKNGTVGQEVSPAPKQYDGFETPQKQTKTVAADGSTSINYQYNRKQFTVHFDGQGGTSPADRTRKYEETVGALPQTTRTNFEFAGWFTDTSFTTQVTGNETVLADTTYYAKWNIIETFPTVWSHPGECEFNNGANLAGETCDYTENTYIDTGIALYKDSETYGKDYEIYFEIEEYGTQVESQATMMNSKLEQSSQKYPGITVRRDNKASDKIEVTQTISSQKASQSMTDQTKYVRVLRIDGVIYYETDQIERTPLQDLNEIDEQYFPTTVWFGAASNSSNKPQRYFVGKLKNMYVKLGKYTDIQTHYISFNANGGEGSMPKQAINTDETSIKIAKNSFRRSLYDFTGWNTQADGNGTSYTDEQIIDGANINDMTLYAQWSRHFYTISYNLDGGVLSVDNPTNYNEDTASFTLINPTKVGYDFVGWIGSNGDEPQSEITVELGSSGDRTYNAVYARKVFTIRFDPNGGVLGSDQEIRNINGGDTLGELPIATRDKYIFQGWYQGIEDGIRVTSDTVPTDSITYYAHWGTAKSLYLAVKADAYDLDNAKTYTGEVTDTVGETLTTDIYYYEGTMPENHVIFAGHCWQIVRTTTTGGVKLIYNGTPNNGKCSEEQSLDRTLGKEQYRMDYYSGFTGYLYDPDLTYHWTYDIADAKFGSGISYDGENYRLTDPVDAIDENHLYSCPNGENACEVARYYFRPSSSTKSYYEFTNNTVHDLTYGYRNNKADSHMKAYIEKWYENNLLPYNNSIEDVVYCSDRRINGDYGDTVMSDNLNFHGYYQRNTLNMDCVNQTDQMSVSNNSAKIKYPVGLLTYGEALLGKTVPNNMNGNGPDDYYLNIGYNYWLMTPYTTSSSSSGFHNMVTSQGEVNYNWQSTTSTIVAIRPAISLNQATVYDYGDGTKDNPFFINTDIDTVRISFDANGGEQSSNDNTKIIKRNDTVGQLPEPQKIGYNFRGWFIDGDENRQISQSSTFGENANVIALWSEQQFHSDSWDTIIENVRNGNTGGYQLGDAKEITVTGYSTPQIVRIMNKTTENNCKIITFSQTACGFILEFEEALAKTKYSSDTVEKVANELIDKLPENIRNAVIETRVAEYVSKSGETVYNQRKGFVPTVTEVYGASGHNNIFIDRGGALTRQLDYYREGGLNTSTPYNNMAAKSYNGEGQLYTLRRTDYQPYGVYSTSGSWTSIDATSTRRFPVSFRIGKEYTITYDANGGTVSPGTAKIEDGGVIASLPEPHRDGYTFIGWYTDLNYNQQIDINYNPTSDMHLYAKWSEDRFHSDSWETIANNIYNNDTSMYNLGDVKEIEMDLDNDGENETYRLRLINKDTPEECNTEGFSQTACGFVVEFREIVKRQSYSGLNTKGSWPKSNPRKSMNETIYDQLPDDLKAVIIDTYVVSGKSNSYTDDPITYGTTDLLYALSTKEVSSDVSYYEYDTSSDYTRTTDFYKTAETDDYKKAYGNSYGYWWLRSPYATSTNYVNTVSSRGELTSNTVYGDSGISPAFRIQKYYKLSLDTKGGTVEKNYKHIVVGEKGGELPDPSRNGYNFAGWYIDEDYQEPYSVDFIPTSNKTIYAKWTPVHYAIHFDARGGEAVQDIDGIYDQEIGQLPEATRSGYNFLGWFTEQVNGEAIDGHEIVYGETTYYAHWSWGANVTYDANGGSFTNNEITKQTSYTVTDAMAQNYSHTPNVNDDGTNTKTYSSYMNINDDLVFPGAHRLEIEIWYGTEGTTDWIGIYPGGVTPSSSNYSEATISNGKLGGCSTSTKPADNSSCHKYFTVQGDEVQFFFHSDSSREYYGYYAIVTAPNGTHAVSASEYEEPTRAGAYFAGWYTSPDCNDGEKFDVENSLSEDITLYAKWEYEIELDANGGELTSEAIRRVKAGNTIGNLPEPTRDEYLFLGWYEASTGDGDIITAEYTPTTSRTIYAKWGDKTFYNLAIHDTAINKALYLSNPDNDSIDENDNNMGVYYYQTTSRYIAFGGYCWEYARTTTSGAIKIRYAGTYGENGCTLGSYGNSAFNVDGYAGYMYNADGIKTDTQPGGDNWKYAESFEYESGSYHLINTTTSYDANHPYACSTVSGWCNEIRYYTNSNNYRILNGQASIDQQYAGIETTVNVHDSTLKQNLENWYENNLLNYDQYVDKNTIYCNNRKLKADGSIDASNGYACKQASDEFAVNNPEAPLRYGIGILTRKEALMQIRGGNTGTTSQGILGSGNQLTMTPYTTTSLAYSYITMSKYYMSSTSATTSNLVKPVIALVKGTKFISGTGTSADPFIADTPAEAHYAITFKDVLNGGKTTTRVINQGEAINEFPTIVEPGHTLEGWYADENYTTAVDTNTVPTGNATYYAKWETSTLYDQIALSYITGDAAVRRYNGMATDSMVNPSKLYDIYFFHGRDIDEHKVNNHVLLGDKCWRIVRTTNTGGLKMIYDGAAHDGVCDNTGQDTWISNNTVNFQNSDIGLAGIGYMYNKTYKYESVKISTDDNKGHVYGASVEYYDNAYHLVDTITTRDNDHRYSCSGTETSCNPVRYYFEKNASNYQYFELNDGLTKEQMIENTFYADDINQTDSKMKQIVEDWYENNMLNYSNLIEDTIYCNDRAIKSFNYGWSTSGMLYKTTIHLFSGYRYWSDSGGTTTTAHTDLRCTQPTDKFSISNAKAPLKYPVGLLTYDEMLLTKKEEGVIGIGTVQDWWMSDGGSTWTMTPASVLSKASLFNIDGGGYGGISDAYSTSADEKNGVRPVITLKNSTVFTEGDGTSEHPYVIDLN